MVKALYAGSFDPPTVAHIDIALRSARIFGGVRILVGYNPAKKGLFTPSERLVLLMASLPEGSGIEFDVWEGLVADYASREGFNLLIRGIRNISDFDSESSMAFHNRKIGNGLETLFLPSDPALSFISSSGIRELLRFGKNLEDLVPLPVFEALQVRFPELLKQDAL